MDIEKALSRCNCIKKIAKLFGVDEKFVKKFEDVLKLDILKETS